MDGNIKMTSINTPINHNNNKIMKANRRKKGPKKYIWARGKKECLNVGGEGGVTDGVYPYIGVGMFFSVYRSEFFVDEKVMKEILQNEQVSYSLAPRKPNTPSKTPAFLFVAKKGNK